MMHKSKTRNFIRTIALVFGGYLVLTAGAALAQQEKDEPPREPQPAEFMPLAEEAIVNDLEPVGDHIVAVGARGHILLFEDGRDWQQVAAPVRAMLTRVVFAGPKNGWAVGWDGAILRSTDGGKTWQLANFEPTWGKPYFDVLITGAESAVVVGSNGRMRVTQDGGQSWQSVDNDVFATGFHLYEIDALADGTLLIAGERGLLARSIDGEHWDMLVPPYIGSYFGVLPFGAHGAVVFGLQGRVFYAADVRKLPILDDPMAYNPFKAQNITDPQALAAMGWQQIRNPVEESLFGASLDADGTMVGVGVDGTIVTGQVASGALQPADSPTTAPLSDVLVREDGLLISGRGGFYRVPRD